LWASAVPANLGPITGALLSDDYAPMPYWWEGVDLPDPMGERPSASVDVAVVGGGYTGLGAALELARRGRSVAVLDSGGIARGASSRNGGMVHPGVKHDLATLLTQARGRRRFDDTLAAYDGLVDLIAECGIDCDFAPTGHLELAHHARQVEGLRWAAAAYAQVGQAASFIGRDDLGDEIGSERFFGGLAVEHSGAVHPAKLAAGIAQAAVSAGASLHPGTSVLGLERRGAGHAVRTTKGEVAAGEVIVATNGTTDSSLVPWLGRRVLPIGSFIIATEPIGPEVAAGISPKGRMFFDTKNFLHYWRLSPDGTRVLFGGRTSFSPTTLEAARDALYGALVQVHPALAGVRVARAWGGQVALTVDRMPHIGRHEASGALYAMGYCGTGVAASVHFGRCLGRWLCDDGELPSFALDRWRPVPAPARVRGLLPVAGWWYRALDALGR
jgi:glycine/D-amino acid oxidase-like deaminating enzyme